MQQIMSVVVGVGKREPTAQDTKCLVVNFDGN